MEFVKIKIETKAEIEISISKSKFPKSKHQNFDEIRIKFCRNFNFVESKITTLWKPYTQNDAALKHKTQGFM
jgi:hypothetical protein